MSEAMPEAEIAGILFDLDGTLYDKRPLIFRMLFQRPEDLRRLRAVFQARRSKSGVAYGSRDALLDALALDAALRLPGQEPWDIRRWYLEHLYGHFVSVLASHFRCRKELRPVLARWARSSRPAGYKGPLIGVLSDYGYVEDRLLAIGLAPRDFDLVMSSEDCGALKPAAAPYLAAAARFGLPPDRILVVGDQDETDRRGAEAAGMAFFKLSLPAEARRFAARFTTSPV